MNYGLIRNCRRSQTLPSAVRSESNLHGATFVSCFFLLPLSYIASSVIDMLPEPSYYIRGNIYSREIQILVSYTENSQAVSRCGSIIRAKNFFLRKFFSYLYFSKRLLIEVWNHANNNCWHQVNLVSLSPPFNTNHYQVFYSFIFLL